MFRNFAGIILSAAALAGCRDSAPQESCAADCSENALPVRAEVYERSTLRESVGEDDVFNLVWLEAPEDSWIRPGRTREIQVEVEQRGYPVPIYFHVENLPPGVRLRCRPWMTAYGDRTLLILDASPAAPFTRRRPIRIVATTADGTVQGSRVVFLNVGPPS